MASIRARNELPDIAKPTVDLAERFGFKWELDFEYPLPDLAKRLQIRDEKHSAPSQMVNQFRAAMKRQGDLREKFPPIVVTTDGHLVDGATRVKAANLNGYPTIQAVVLDATYEGATDSTRSRLWALGAGYNARNGKGIDRAEIQRAVDQLSANPIFDATRIAALIGVTDNTVRGFMAERRARDRAATLNVDLNGKVPAATVKTIGRSADSLNNEPYKALLELVRDAGVGGIELSGLITRMKEQKSDQGALDVVDEERKARKEQIEEYKASGRTRPPAAGRLRQSLGFLLNNKDNPDTLLERNPDLATLHQSVIDDAIAVLTQLRRRMAEPRG